MERVAEFLQYMLQQGHLTQEQQEWCRRQLQKSEANLYQLLVGQKRIEEEVWAEATADFYGLPMVELTLAMVDKNCQNNLPQTLQKRYHLLPYRQVDGKLRVAVTQLPSRELLEDLALFNQREIDFVLVEPEALESIGFALHSTESMEEERRRVYFIAQEMEENNLAAQMISSAIQKALVWRASDIHIEALASEVLVKLRVDGLLRPLWYLPKGLHGSLINRLKIMAEMDIAEKRLPQDGHIVVSWQEQLINIRVSTLPFIYGEKAVLRILGQETSLLEIDQLGFEAENLKKIQRALTKPYGLILITGPTGSGKTTTLYSLLNALKGQGRNVVTIEDPVEYEQPGINQMQVNEKIGLTFSKGLRGILRQDPDIIMIGEIRDAETAAIAVRAANTGHMVLGSMHTNNAASAVLRLLEMGIEPFLVASSLAAVIAQRLVRRNCADCLAEDEAQSRQLSQLLEHDAMAYRGVGCAQCRGSGFKGRLALQEVWLVDGADRQAILEHRFAVDTAAELPYQTMRQDGLLKVGLGQTLVDEVLLATMMAEE